MFATTIFTYILPAKVRKNLAIVLISLLITNINLYAQYYDGIDQWTGGFVAGGNISQVDGDGYKGYNKISPNVGGIIYIPIPNFELANGKLAWSMEVLYAGKGASGKGAGRGSMMLSQDINLTYAEVPVQLNLWRGPRKNIYGAGLALGYLGASEEKITMIGGQVYSFPFRKIDLSFLMTANFHIGAGFYISPRFQYSLLSIRKKNNDLMAFGRTDQFNNIWSLRLMYLFNTK